MSATMPEFVPMDAPDLDPNAPLLEIRDLEVAFQSSTGMVPAVRGANLTIYPGQSVAIVGESGSGKSTTAHAIINLLPGTGKVTGGTIRFAGQDITHAPRKVFEQLRGKEIGLVPQDPMSNLNPVWKIGFQVKETLVANGVAQGKELKDAVARVLADAGLPDAEHRAKQYPHEFSGGMRQRALIGIGLAGKPRLLIADEPTSALDVTVQRQILDHLEHLTQDRGVAVLFITHDLGLAAERAEHLVVMHRGRVVESGPARQILTTPQHPYTQRLVASAPSLTSRRIQSAKERGVESTELLARTDIDESRPIVEVEHLTKEFHLRGALPGAGSTFKAVDDVSFSIARGSTTALVGESGSGKSTVANVMLNLLEPTSGRVVFEGTEVGSLSKSELFDFRRQVQPIFQNPYGSLDPMYSIFRTIEEPLRVHGVGSKKTRSKRVAELLDMVSLPTSAMRRYPNELSGGQRQRVAIARALALEPKLIVCDEAVSALDVLVQAQVLTLLNDLQAELGLTYLFITHDLAVVRQIADHVAVMQRGKIVELATTDEVFESPREAYTRELLAAIPGSSLEVGGA
ncbi:ABC transporter ATP-binding protein [Flavimobilis marinus]|uniref:Peptide/nickel transport system ATP-binding protein n=1 Tax=Flavimobilis marinus TaxID=285351 RepID=A0A1I2DMR7_9MICO|nr:ABC transporter ATP-binding protein [Flavimobilis marinus]GHG44855.1 ABC transporter ATP-binding protein [Flavimobilis marinus]SFE81621.1 peptide/nickel transport system ATP-binding protein [Flavimobilis marinus]